MTRIEIDDSAGADGVRVITFDRPEVRNAFDSAMYHDVTQALHDADQSASVGAVVLTGRGSAFTSGQDLAEMAAIATGTAADGAGQGFMGLLEILTQLSVPLLAAVNGVAVGLGFTLLAHCDLVLVDASARLRVPFAELGVPAEAASSVLFPARMGWQQAARLLLTSDWVGAQEAVDLGVALRVCPEGTVLPETVALAGRIAAHPRAATRAIIRLMRAGQRDLVQAANQREQAAFAQLLGGAASAGALADFAARDRP
jgi:enoyl-CoA hydratase/carnithine racemase